MMKNNGRSLRQRIKSFQYAFNGIRLLITGEPNAWIHAVATVIVIGLGAWLKLSRLEWIAIVIVIGSVWAAEAFNSAIEALSDVVSTDYHEGIRRTKDMAAGAVLLAAITAVVVGLIIFLPKLINLM